MKRSGIDWLKAAAIRAIRTMAQTALSMLTVGMAIKDVDWVQLVSISLVAGLISVLTSLATGLPEVTTVGSITIDTDTDNESGLMGLSVDENVTKDLLDKFKSKGIISFRVNEDK